MNIVYIPSPLQRATSPVALFPLYMPFLYAFFDCISPSDLLYLKKI